MPARLLAGFLFGPCQPTGKTVQDMIVVVECSRGGAKFAVYKFDVPCSAGAPLTVPSQETFLAEAKANLANEGKADPPYAGISFSIQRIFRS